MKNRLREKYKNGEVAIGTFFSTASTKRKLEGVDSAYPW